MQIIFVISIYILIPTHKVYTYKRMIVNYDYHPFFIFLLFSNISKNSFWLSRSFNFSTEPFLFHTQTYFSINSIVFIIKFLTYLVKVVFVILGFVNPFGESFFKLKGAWSLVGEGAYLLLLLYFVYVLYCFTVHLK